jgi:outer membrane protein OmpA-like peptidoglycan-associated protein
MLEALFQGGPLRKTAQGWWLRAGDVSRLTDVVRSIQKQFPRQVGQLSVMYRCLPDEHQDEAVLRSTLKMLRQQCKQIKSLTGFTLPVVVNAEFSGPETPWIIVRGDKPIVCPVNDSPQAFIDWQQAEDNILLLPTVSQAFSFIRNTLTDELEKPDRLTPPVRVFSVAMRLGVVNPEAQTVWSTWLCARTCLQFSRQPGQSVLATLFPDAVLPLLAPFASTVQGGQRTRRLVLLMWLCALTALGISALNNRDLIRQVSADLQRWNAIPMNHYRPKADSLAALKQDALLLERWQRQGEPLRYSLGYYPGQRLWLALQQAIDTWTPPPAPEPKPVPKIVRLDSMSLFDSGKSALKEGSTKILVNALVGIKAKPGWLIVVSGHTDNTGSIQLNQTLSLQRAEAVRNWMRDTGDVPESCFAVQGYGNSRPIASNDTPDGRAHNRRVEISLVPQADACRLPGAKHASQDVRDVSTQEMEK